MTQENKIAHLNEVERTCQLPAYIVSSLEKLMSEVQSGRIKGIAISAVDRGHEVITLFAEDGCCPSLIGATEYLKHRLIRYWDKKNPDENMSG